jgi:methionine biosynthesis protein MetW
MELSEFYDCYWSAKDDNVDHRRLDLMVDLVRKGERVLQVDCGPGMLAQRLEAKGAIVTGTDLSLVAVERARQKGIDAQQVSLDDERLPFSDSTFDVVISDSAIEHHFFYREALAECVRVLRPGGRFIILLPNIGHWRFRLWLLAGRFPYIKDAPTDLTHLRFFTLREGKQLCESLGLMVRRSDGSASLWVRGLYPSFLRRPIVRSLYTRAARIWPSLLARDFVLLCEKPVSRLGDTIHTSWE